MPPVPQAGLDGPSRTIIVEPVEQPATAPPVREPAAPERVPAPAERENEPAPA